MNRFKNLLKFLSIALITFILLEGFYRVSLKLISYSKYKDTANTYNLCMVGGSTAAGVPFHPDVSIAKLVAYSFGNKINDKEIKTINLGAAGMPIATAYWATRELVLGIDSGTMLLYTGINDRYFENESRRIFLFKLLNKSWVLSKIAYRLNPWYTNEQRFKFYYGEILKMLEDNGWTVISSTLVGNYRDYSPDVGYDNFIEEDTSLLEQVSIDILSTKKSLNLKEDAPFSLFLKAHSLNKYNKDSASYYFQQAVNVDHGHSRPPSFKIEHIKQLNEKFGVSYIEPMPEFIKHSDGDFPGYNLFMDAHHPTLEGYIILSNLFAEELAKYHAVSYTKLNKEAVERAFNINNELYDRAYLITIEWHMLECLYSLYYYDRLQISKAYLDKIKVKNESYYYWKIISLIFEEDFERFKAFYKANKEKADFSFTLLEVDEYNRIKNKLKKGIALGVLTDEEVRNFLKIMN